MNLRCFLISSVLPWILFASMANGQQSEIADLFMDSHITALLSDQVGIAVLNIVHPLCKHISTKTVSTSGNSVTLKTKYSFITNNYMMVYSLRLDSSGLPVDFAFINDTNPVKTGNLVNALKREAGPHIHKFIDDAMNKSR